MPSNIVRSLYIYMHIFALLFLERFMQLYQLYKVFLSHANDLYDFKYS